VKRALLLTTLVAILVFAFAGTAFAAYSVNPIANQSIAVGNSIGVSPVFQKATGDLAGAEDYVEIRVTGPGADTGSVVTVAGWDVPHRVYGPGATMSLPFADYVVWTGNTAQTPGAAPTLQFAAAGTYQVDVWLVRDVSNWPSNPILSPTASYTVTVAAPPPPAVSTPASSPWSLALLAASALAVAGGVTIRRRRSA
jgi:hypothetical protein